MASIASAGTSPLSGYEYTADSTGDPDENLWAMINASSTSSNAGLSLSPASGSLGSWALVGGHGNQAQPSPPAAFSPLNLDFDQPASFAASPYEDAASNASGMHSVHDAQFLVPGTTQDAQQFLTPEEMMFADQAFANTIGKRDISSWRKRVMD
jgi:hypothetical protein